MTISKLIIKPLSKEDVDRVSEIEAEAYGEHHWSKDSFYSEINNKVAKYYTAQLEDGYVVGYIGTWHIVDEAHITTIATGKDYLRNKVAECLIVKSLQDCYNEFIKYITLEVRVSNIPAIKLYEKYGFKSLGTRKGYYQDNNEDALIMWTENIFSDEYKELFQKNVQKLQEMVTFE
ncbi:ribosomal protein S18-alanine N-acetyltransferase [bacterium]|nr:ribosomal protein S18-alanine N-acetyltransferase [bacterium]